MRKCVKQTRTELIRIFFRRNSFNSGKKEFKYIRHWLFCEHISTIFRFDSLLENSYLIDNFSFNYFRFAFGWLVKRLFPWIWSLWKIDSRSQCPSQALIVTFSTVSSAVTLSLLWVIMRWKKSQFLYEWDNILMVHSSTMWFYLNFISTFFSELSTTLKKLNKIF